MSMMLFLDNRHSYTKKLGKAILSYIPISVSSLKQGQKKARKDIPPGKLFSHFDPNVFEIFKVKA